jgi:hypothetical protein
MNQLTHEKRIAREKQLIDEQHANALENLGAGTFSSSNTRQQSGYNPLPHRVFHEQTPASAARRDAMNTPVKRPKPSPEVHEMISTTLSQHRAITEQADFLRLLETEYGAEKKADGTYVEGTYETAIEKYLIEMDRQRAKRSASIAKINEEKERQFHSAQMADAALFRYNMQHQEKPKKPDEEKKPGWSGWWQNMRDKAGKYARGYSGSQQYSRPQQDRERSRSPPKQAEGVPPRMTKAEALMIMGFAANSDPSYDILKQNFRKLALQFHPDKNIGKNASEITELTSKLEEMQKAFEFLKNNGNSDSGRHGGGIIKRRHKRHKTSKKARRNTRRKTRGKTHRKSHRKSNKRR